MRRLILAGAGLLVLAGCSVPAPHAPPLPEPAPAPTAVPAPVGAVADPARIDIPKIGAQSQLVPTGKDADGGWEVPPLSQPELASWFEPGPEPGESGRPSVILGHVNGSGRPGVFARAHELAPGDAIVITDVAGYARTFEVTRVQEEPKTAFVSVSQEALSATTEPEIRLVTCGGELERVDGRGRYTSNVIVYGRLAA